MKVSLIIFTMNEVDGMKAIMPKINKDWYDELIIVDGGSTDGTIEFAQKEGYYIFVQEEKGAGAAFKEALRKATGDIVITFSPDGNSLPEKIPEIVVKIKEGYDVVTVSRYLCGAKSYDDDAFTAFGTGPFNSMRVTSVSSMSCSVWGWTERLGRPPAVEHMERYYERPSRRQDRDW